MKSTYEIAGDFLVATVTEEHRNLVGTNRDDLMLAVIRAAATWGINRDKHEVVMDVWEDHLTGTRSWRFKQPFYSGEEA